MPTYYVKYRKNGPTAVYSVIAADAEAAKSMVRRSGAPGEEFDIWDANTTGYSIASVTGPTGP
jgi:hypothetical protein